MSNRTNPEDYLCPCCTEYIYDRYGCQNNHLFCGNCFMRIKVCPICRDPKLIDRNDENATNVERRACKNKHKGCSSLIYTFDDDHEKNCMYNSFHCRFCSGQIEDQIEDQGEDQIKQRTNQRIVDHFRSFCGNSCAILTFPKQDLQDETKGRSYRISNLKTQMTLIVIEDEYLILILPKVSRRAVNMMAFSLNHRYRHSNYKIEIRNTNTNTKREAMIHYNALVDFMIPLDHLSSGNVTTLNFTIENSFILNRRTKHTTYGNNVHFYETYTVDGEPGSAGNWTKEQHDDAVKKFTELFESFV